MRGRTVGRETFLPFALVASSRARTVFRDLDVWLEELFLAFEALEATSLFT